MNKKLDRFFGKILKALLSMVRVVGLEPTRPCGHQILREAGSSTVIQFHPTVRIMYPSGKPTVTAHSWTLCAHNAPDPTNDNSITDTEHAWPDVGTDRDVALMAQRINSGNYEREKR